MRTRLFGTIAIAALALTACGGDDDGGGQQTEVADMMIASAEEEGMALDEGCVRDVADQLSDEDAEKMIAAGEDGDADLSAEAEALAEDMFDCLDTDALVDQIVADMDGEGIDADCLKELLDEEGLAALEGAGMFECITVGG